MRKRIFSVLVLLALICTLAIQAAQAAEARSLMHGPFLAFLGNTAQCSATYRSDSASDSVSATLTLNSSTGPVASWNAVGAGCVSFSSACQVDFDRRYRLELAVSVNGVPLPVQSVSAICPRP